MMSNLRDMLRARRPGVARIPEVRWPREATLWPEPMRCPNCGSGAPKTVRLAVRWKTIDDPSRVMSLLRCPGCTALFFQNQRPPDYTEPSLLEKGRVPFYLQQGAGVSLITRPIARLNLPAGSTYLDVGCGFGFGLDFAIAERGWTGQGIDPAPLAALGREMLGLDIAPRYLEPADAAGQKRDVVMSSETIEHVRSPLAFVRTLRWALKPGGVLVLTTPDADRLEPSVPPGTLVPLLSPGLHLVFQNRESLRGLLLQSGFTHVEMEEDGYSVVAYASDRPIPLEPDAAVVRGRYRAYLERRAVLAPPGSDLFLAMAGRALSEAASDGDMQAASRAWDMLVPACRARFGIELDDPSLPPAEAAGASLERMAEIAPVNLAGILYARAMQLLAGGAGRAAVEPALRAAIRAAEALRAALHDIAIDDVQTADLAWVARAELVLCAAERGAPDVQDELRRLPDAPGEQRGRPGGRRETVAARVLTALVNAGQYARAKAVAASEGLRTAAWAGAEGDPAPPPALCDALFSLAILDLRQPADFASARARMRRVQDIVSARQPGAAAPALWHAALRGELEAVVGLGLADEADRVRERIAAACRREEAAARALTGLVNAGRYEEAAALARSERLQDAWWARPDDPRDEAAPPVFPAVLRDGLFSLAVLDLQQPANPVRARSRMRRVRGLILSDAGPPPPGLLASALNGELLAVVALGMADEADRLRTLIGTGRPPAQTAAE